MSAQMAMEAKKKPTPAAIRPHSLRPQHGLSLLPRHAEETPAPGGRSLGDTLAQPSWGHDFSRVRVNTPDSDVIRPKLALRPPSSDLATLRRQASIYRQGKTPVVDGRGNLQAWGIAPANEEVTARHLGEVHRRFGEEGLTRSVHGLAITRGTDFADEAMHKAAVTVRKKVTVAQASAANRETSAGSSPSAGALAPASIHGAGPGKPVPAVERSRLAQLSGHSLDDVRIHDDGASHRTAQMLNARAFTVGSSIYFGENEYRPTSTAGMHLLAHEVAHAVQQRGTSLRPRNLEVSVPGSTEEQEAERFADAAVGKESAAPRLSSGRAGAARVMRVISFTRSNDRITTRSTRFWWRGPKFTIKDSRRGYRQIRWLADVTIHGSPGDPFDDWAIGSLQVVRDWKLNIFYGRGADQRVYRARARLPAPDYVGTGTKTARGWYDVDFVEWASSSGDILPSDIRSGAGTGEFYPEDHPSGKAVSRCEFVKASVVYLSAHDARAGETAGFRPLAHMWWRVGISGVFDLKGDLIRTHGGKPTRGNVVSGTSSQFPPMPEGSYFRNTITWTPREP